MMDSQQPQPSLPSTPMTGSGGASGLQRRKLTAEPAAEDPMAFDYKVPSWPLELKRASQQSPLVVQLAQQHLPGGFGRRRL